MSPGLGGARAVCWLAVMTPADRLRLAKFWLTHARADLRETFQLLITSAPVLEAVQTCPEAAVRPLVRHLLVSEAPWAREFGIRVVGMQREATPPRDPDTPAAGRGWDREARAQ